MANQAAEAGHDVTIIAALATDAAQWPAPLHPKVALRLIAAGASRTIAVYPRLPGWMLKHRRWLLGQDVVHCHLTFGAIFGASMQALRLLAGTKRPAVIEDESFVGMAVPMWRRSLHAKMLSSRDAVAFMALDPYLASASSQRGRRDCGGSIPNGVAPPAASGCRYGRSDTAIARHP